MWAWFLKVKVDGTLGGHFAWAYSTCRKLKVRHRTNMVVRCHLHVRSFCDLFDRKHSVQCQLLKQCQLLNNAGAIKKVNAPHGSVCTQCMTVISFVTCSPWFVMIANYRSSKIAGVSSPVHWYLQGFLSYSSHHTRGKQNQENLMLCPIWSFIRADPMSIIIIGESRELPCELACESTHLMYKVFVRVC